MRSRIAVGLLIAVLAACDKTGVPTRTGGGPGVRKSPAAQKSKAPTAAPSAVASGPDVLRAPSREATALRGRIALDARYAVGSGFISDQGGGLISNNGGGVLAVKGAELLSNNAGNLVSREAASIIGHNGAGLVGKAKFISDQGGGLISNNGGGLISDGGGGLVSNNGGGVVARFGLLADPAPAAAATTGLPHKPLPVAGMLVGVMSLADGAYLPLGVDREGKPVYAVYTDRDGNFAVHLPKALARNVLVVSCVPGTQDLRLAVDLVATPAADQALVVDDASTVVTGYLRRAIVARFEETLDADPCRPVPQTLSTASYGFGIAALPYKDLLEGPAYKALPRPARLRVLGRFTDAAIAEVELGDIDVVEGFAEGSRATGPAFPLLVGMLDQLRGAAAAKLAESPTYFDDKLYLTIANRERGSGPPMQVRKPTDLTELVVNGFLTTSDLSVMQRLDAVLADVGLSPALQEDMQAAGGSLFSGIAKVMGGAESAPRLRKAIEDALAEEKGAPDPEPTCVPTAAPAALEAEVTTLAGGPEAGWQDGTGPTARFNRPGRLAYDPRGYLLVSELEAHRVRRIDLNDPDRRVTTVAGTSERGWRDGPGATAQFSAPSGLALDAQGALYVAERGGHRIRKITGWEGTSPEVSTFAGAGVPDVSEGTGTAARFNAPDDLAFGPDGTLYVADTENDRIRRITPAGVVSTLAGSGENTSRNEVGAKAAFKEPRGLVHLPGAGLIVADSDDSCLRLVGLLGAAARFGGLLAEGFADGGLFDARYHAPHGLAVGPGGEVIVADTRNHRIRRIDKQGFVTTLAGQGAGGKDAGAFAEGRGAAAAFDSPEGVAVAKDGTVYVADSRNHRIRALKLPPR